MAGYESLIDKPVRPIDELTMQKGTDSGFLRNSKWEVDQELNEECGLCLDQEGMVAGFE